MQNAWLDEAQAGIKIARRNISNLKYADDTTLMAESKEELKGLLMKVKEETEKAGLKLNVQKKRSWHPVPSSFPWDLGDVLPQHYCSWFPCCQIWLVKSILTLNELINGSIK